MKENVVDHLSKDEWIITRREGFPTIDALERRYREPVVYPVVETLATGNKYGYLGDPQPTPEQRVWHKIPSCCWHDLLRSDSLDLAGMGLSTIGNICRMVARKKLSIDCDARFELILEKGARPIKLPWPGMETDAPIDLDLCKLPFDPAMFFHDEDGQFKHRVDRQQLMFRIQNVWVPYLMALLGRKS